MSSRRPDPDSLLYARHWEPVLAGPAHRLLDGIETRPALFLDIGAGTGSLALAAAERWPAARIVALDASAGMLSVAQHRVASGWPADDAGRFEWLTADAAALPLADDTVDVVVSSFMLQLADDRRAVLDEVRRVLRPGGIFGLVTWIAQELVLGADDAFEAVIAELGLEQPGATAQAAPSHEYASVGEARDELVAAGFSDVDARAEELRYAWTREGYLVFKEQYDDLDLFESLEASDRARLRTALLHRWAGLPDTAFALASPLVRAVARCPGTVQAAKGLPSSGRQTRQGR